MRGSVTTKVRQVTVDFNMLSKIIIFEKKENVVHLHDNDKSDDLHLLPFDGTIDWNYVMNKIVDMILLKI